MTRHSPSRIASGRLLLFLLGCSSCAAQRGSSAAIPAAGAAGSGLAAAGAVAGADSATLRHARFVPLLQGPRPDVELLSGHPDSAGQPFVMRIRELAGTVIPLHRHPVDEHLTVLRGSIRFGTGTRFDSTALRTLDAGSYAFLPAGTTMFAVVDDEAVVQVHGVGPFHIHWLNGLAVLDTSAAEQPPFRFRIGEAVVGSRGMGTVVEGYASGALVQYVVQRRDSTRYMAHQAELRR